jgi:hypothetical protein
MKHEQFTRNELDWLLKRALDRRAEVTSNPTIPAVDDPLVEFLTGIINKLYALIGNQ